MYYRRLRFQRDLLFRRLSNPTQIKRLIFTCNHEILRTPATSSIEMFNPIIFLIYRQIKVKPSFRNAYDTQHSLQMTNLYIACYRTVFSGTVF